jgi:tetratricopeptide (TPR) repeat protein
LLNNFGDNPAIPSMAGEAIRLARDLGDDATAADALSQLCVFRYQHGDLPAALADIDEAVGLARTAGDPRLIAEVLGRRAVFKSDLGDMGTAYSDLAETLTLSRAAGDSFRLATTLASLGARELTAGELRAARAHLEQASTLADDRGYQNLSAGVRLNLGFVDLIEDDPRHARSLFLDILDTVRIIGARPWIHSALFGLALAATADGDPAVAATLHGVAYEHYEQAGRVFEAYEAGLRDRDHARLRATLGDAAFEAAYRRGCALSQADAIALASAAAEPGPMAAPAAPVPAAGQAAGGSAGPLSEREREIVALLAGGGDRRPDRRAAVPVGQHRAIASGADQGQDRRPPPDRTGPLRHPGRHRPTRPSSLRTAACPARLPSGGEWGRPAHTCRADGAVRPLLSSSGRAHAGYAAPPPGRAANRRGRHGIDSKNTLSASQRRVRMNTRAVSWMRGRAGRYAATALGAVAVLASAAYGPVAAQAAAPKTLYVSQGGLDSGTCPKTSPCATVSYALTKAAPHATIEVSGTIDDNPVISSPVTITTWPGGPVGSPAVLDGTESGTVVTVGGVTGVTLNDLTIENGSLGILNSEGTLTLTDSTVSRNANGRNRTPESGTTPTAPRLSSTARSRRTRARGPPASAFTTPG